MIFLNQTMQPWLFFEESKNILGWISITILAFGCCGLQLMLLFRFKCTMQIYRAFKHAISYTVIERRFVYNEGKQALSMLPCMECQTCQRLERYRVADNIVDFVNSIQSIIHKQINIIEKASAADARPRQ